jgi:AcrR family transcriptional regulator
MDAVGTDTQSPAPTSAPPTPQRTEQIASAALGLFLDHGVDRTTLREIADRAGLSKSGLYHHVAAKADILDLIVGPYIAALDAVVAAAAPSKLDALRSAVQVQILYRDVARLISTDVTAATHARAAGLPRVLDQVHDLLEPAPGGQTARHLARAAWAAATEITASPDASDIRRIEPLAVSIARAVLNVQAPDADSPT